MRACPLNHSSCDCPGSINSERNDSLGRSGALRRGVCSSPVRELVSVAGSEACVTPVVISCFLETSMLMTSMKMSIL